MTETTEVLRRRLTDLATRPDEQAHSMPAAYYTDPDWLTGEEEMLHSQWMCVGHIGEVRKPGNFFTTELLDKLVGVSTGPTTGQEHYGVSRRNRNHNPLVLSRDVI